MKTEKKVSPGRRLKEKLKVTVKHVQLWMLSPNKPITGLQEVAVSPLFRLRGLNRNFYLFCRLLFPLTHYPLTEQSQLTSKVITRHLPL